MLASGCPLHHLPPSAISYANASISSPRPSPSFHIPQSQLAVSGAVEVPARQRLHPLLQPRPLHDERGERWGRHGGWMCGGGVVVCRRVGAFEAVSVVSYVLHSQKANRITVGCDWWILPRRWSASSLRGRFPSGLARHPSSGELCAALPSLRVSTFVGDEHAITHSSLDLHLNLDLAPRILIVLIHTLEHDTIAEPRACRTSALPFCNAFPRRLLLHQQQQR